MKVKGTTIKARIAFVKQRFGEEGWQKVLNALPKDDHTMLDGLIMHVGWYPFDGANRLDAAIVSTVGGGSFAVFEELGRASARDNLTGVHRHALVVGNPQAFMEKAQMIYEFYYDTGQREWQSTGPKSGFIVTRNAETFSAADCATVVGWYKEALVMCGAKNPTVAEEVCRSRGDAMCRYRISWE